MAKQHLLLVDGDPRSLRIMEVSLRRAGFTVSAAANGREALERCATSTPDLVLSETRLAEMDGFELCRRVKGDERLRGAAFIFLTAQRSLDDQVRGLELGVEDYLTKPIYIREVVTRVKLLLEKREKERLAGWDAGATFSGDLGQVGVVDLVQTLELGKRSGGLHIEDRRGRGGVAWFRDGRIVDCEAGPAAGAPAFYRLLEVQEGRFAFQSDPVEREERIGESTQALLLEGMRRIDEWGRAAEGLPPLEAIPELDFRVLAERLGEIPDDLNALLRLVDGRRTLEEIIAETDRERLEAAGLIAKLLAEGILQPGGHGATSSAVTKRGAQEADWFAGPVSAVTPDLSPEAPPRIVRFPAKLRGPRTTPLPLRAGSAGGEQSPAVTPAVNAGTVVAAAPPPGAEDLRPRTGALPATSAKPRWRRLGLATALAAGALAATGGIYTLRERRLVRAEESYRAALESAGRRYAAGDLAGAVEDYRRAAAARETGAALTGLGRALYDVRQRGAALDALARAIEVDAGHADAYMALGDIYMLENQPVEARRSYERYLALAPQGGRAAELRALLAEMK